MDTSAERNTAYAEFLTGLADLRDDVATGRFDAALAALETSGQLQPGEAARLRYWQRESLRTQADQLVLAASASLAALDRARAEAAAAVESADAIWQIREDAPTSASMVPEVVDLTEPDQTAVDLDVRVVLVPAAAAPSTDDSDQAPEVPPTTPRGRHRAPLHARTSNADDTEAPSESADALAPSMASDITPNDLGEQASPVSPPAEAHPGAASPPARRRRLLVAGLTVVDNSDDPSETDPSRATVPHDHPAVG